MQVTIKVNAPNLASDGVIEVYPFGLVKNGESVTVDLVDDENGTAEAKLAAYKTNPVLVVDTGRAKKGGDAE